MRYAFVSTVTLLACAILAGCGSQRGAAHVETIPSDGSFPQITVTVYGNSAADCASDADAYARNAALLLAHSGPEAGGYPADLYYFNMRNAFRDFQVRGCSRSIIGGILVRRFSRSQLRMLLAHLPSTMAPMIRAALAG